MLHPRLAGRREVGCPPRPRARQVAAEVEHPARGDALHAAPQITAGEAEQVTVRARQGGEELVVLALHPIGPQGELAAGAGPLVVGQEGVVADDRGERALGESEDHHEIEVEADPHLDRADEHTIPEATDAAEVLLELELERAVEHLEGDGLLHRVERTEPVQRLVDALGRSVLDGIPSLAAGAATEEPDEPPLGPVGVVAPGPGLRGLGREVVDHLQHEPAQIASPVGLLALSLGHPLGEVVVELGLVGSLVAQQGVLAEAQIPVAPARDDGGLAGQPIPAGGGREAAVAEDRGRRQPREDVLASVAARGEAEQVEQACGPRPAPRVGRRRHRWSRRRRHGAARGRGGHRARDWRAAPRSGRAGCRCARPRRPCAPPLAPLRRCRTRRARWCARGRPARPRPPWPGPWA